MKMRKIVINKVRDYHLSLPIKYNILFEADFPNYNKSCINTQKTHAKKHINLLKMA